jgi:hypothetical protein
MLVAAIISTAIGAFGGYRMDLDVYPFGWLVWIGWPAILVVWPCRALWARWARKPVTSPADWVRWRRWVLLLLAISILMGTWYDRCPHAEYYMLWGVRVFVRGEPCRNTRHYHRLFLPWIGG